MKPKNPNRLPTIAGATIATIAAAAATGVIITSTSQATEEKPEISVFSAQPGSFFDVNSEIVTSGGETMVVDTQFEKSNANKLVEKLKDSQANVTKIFISAADPDYYFGAKVVKDAYPEAELIATPETLQIIEQSKDAKLGVWGPQMGDNAPDEIITPTAIDSDTITVGKASIEIHGRNGNDPDHIFLWEPTSKTAFGGNQTGANAHLWIADAHTPWLRSMWRDNLTAIKQLQPNRLIPGHGDPENTTIASLDWTIDYLHAFDKAYNEAAGSPEAIIESMKKAYPNLAGESSLEMSANVVTGKQEWQVYHSFAGIGKKVTVDFGDFKFDLKFDEKNLTFTQLDAANPLTDTMAYHATLVGPKTFMVTWQEPKTNDRVTHVEDYGSGKVYTNIASNDGKFLNLQGTLTAK